MVFQVELFNLFSEIFQGIEYSQNHGESYSNYALQTAE